MGYELPPGWSVRLQEKCDVAWHRAGFLTLQENLHWWRGFSVANQILMGYLHNVNITETAQIMSFLQFQRFINRCFSLNVG